MQADRVAANTVINKKRGPGTDADGILDELSTRQHLTPHLGVGDVVDEVVGRVGACPEAAGRALRWLELDRSRPVGRLKRGELIQLARAMYRLWSQALASAAGGAGSGARSGAGDGADETQPA